MKHRVLLLSLVLCCHVRNISPAAIVVQKGASEPEPTNVERERHQESNVELPLKASARYLQSVAEKPAPEKPAPPPPAPATTNAPSEEPTMTIPKPAANNQQGLPWIGPDPCPPSNTCPTDSNLMHKSCDIQCVPDARVGRKKLAGWVCGRC
jgi:hypothetical protein